ncbi:MAG: hypothetical protein WA924_13030 [Burkholderiaceae bacterium]
MNHSAAATTKGVLTEFNGQYKTGSIFSVPAAESGAAGEGGFFFGKSAVFFANEFHRWRCCRHFFWLRLPPASGFAAPPCGAGAGFPGVANHG